MNLIVKFNSLFYLFFSQTFYRLFMFQFGSKSRIIKPLLILNYKHISVGNNVLIRNGARIEVVDPQNEVVIKIGNNVNIEQNVHIVARYLVQIGNNVTITGGCSIVDVIHPYDEINTEHKIGDRISQGAHPVYIGDDSFVGYGAHISPNVRVGKNCIIGANSVVTKDVPDYCVVAGAPARIIKRYCHESKSWKKVSYESI